MDFFLIYSSNSPVQPLEYPLLLYHGNFAHLLYSSEFLLLTTIFAWVIAVAVAIFCFTSYIFPYRLAD